MGAETANQNDSKRSSMLQTGEQQWLMIIKLATVTLEEYLYPYKFAMGININSLYQGWPNSTRTRSTSFFTSSPATSHVWERDRKEFKKKVSLTTLPGNLFNIYIHIYSSHKRCSGVLAGCVSSHMWLELCKTPAAASATVPMLVHNYWTQNWPLFIELVFATWTHRPATQNSSPIFVMQSQWLNLDTFYHVTILTWTHLILSDFGC